MPCLKMTPFGARLAKGLIKLREAFCMKDHVHFFIVFTLLEILFTGLYYSVVKAVDTTVVIGAGLYAGSMIAGYFSYRAELYKKRKKELLDALP